MQTENEQDGQMSFFDQDIWFSKMSQDCFPQMTEKPSESSSKRRRELPTVVPLFLDCRQGRLGLTLEPFWQTDGLSLGEYTQVSFGVSPKDVIECRLSQILEDKPLPKYYLSEKACQGILRRAEKRGKELPPILKEALLRQAGLSKFGGGTEVDSRGKKAGKGALIQEEKSGTLGVTQDQTLICFGVSPYASNAMKSDNPNSGIYEAETSRTLDLHGSNPDCQQGGIIVLENHPQASRIKIKEDGIFQTMGARQGGEGEPQTMLVLEMKSEPMVMENSLANGRIETSGIVPTLTARSGTGGNNCPIHEALSLDEEVSKPLNCLDDTMKVLSTENGAIGVVRRLTPLECERLQGFPDNFTNIGEWTDSKGKKHKSSDAYRYKALGNSIAVGYANNKRGFWCWLADRIVKTLKEQGTEEPTMASLFDGIGGFPLAFSAYGCRPVWASEIEEFPIAVTKYHFPEKEEESHG